MAERNKEFSKQTEPAVVMTPTTPRPIVAGAEAFYRVALQELARSNVPFVIAGAYAFSAYTGITRATKDLDVFCKASDYPRLLAHFQRLNYAITVEDELWIAKVHSGVHYIDIIFASPNGVIPVTDDWINNGRPADVFGTRVQIVGPTELLWSKSFIQQHNRYEGADIAHLILKAHEEIDWSRLLSYMDAHWEILFAHLINFRWIYPSERACVPSWLMHELMDRLRIQLELPPSKRKICRGGMLSPADYLIDTEEWNFADFSGKGGAKNAS